MLNFIFNYDEGARRFVFESGEGVKVSYSVEAIVEDIQKTVGGMWCIFLKENDNRVKTVSIGEGITGDIFEFWYSDNKDTRIIGELSPYQVNNFIDALDDGADDFSEFVEFVEDFRLKYLC